jgi:glycosyltransferase involved in cell wall biosynthesis
LKNNIPIFPLVSVVIPALNEESNIGRVVRSIFSQCPYGTELEVIVVDDGSCDKTVEEAKEAGATVLAYEGEDNGGNPAAARNRGIRLARGDPLIFLDADCVPVDGWLQALLAAHQAGAVIVGGSLELPPGLPWIARCDYYCGWYLVHPRRTSWQGASSPASKPQRAASSISKYVRFFRAATTKRGTCLAGRVAESWIRNLFRAEGGSLSP